MRSHVTPQRRPSPFAVCQLICPFSYASQLWKGDDVSAKALAIVCIWVTTFINCLGVSTAAKLQNAFTGLKVPQTSRFFIATITH